MRVVMIGDVGVVDDMVHIGDEAMFEAARDELSARGAEVVGISSSPAETARRYGVRAVGRIGFDGLDRASSEARLAAVLSAADNEDTLAPGDAAHAVIAAVADADGVVVAGGGNLASTWPLHVYERAALAGIAARCGKPLAVTGQTLGPRLDARDRELVARLLGSARRSGVREAASQRLAADLGIDARLGVDDASFLGMTAADADTPRSGVLVSLSLSLGGAPRAKAAARIAALVDAAADEVGGPVRFHAHFGPLAGVEPRGDALLHEEVRALMRAPSSVVPSGDARSAASLARSSALLITGRYHPAVFAAPAGVPVLGLVTDDYTAIKQRGALAHWGQDAVVPIAEADSRGIPRMRSLWAERAAIAAEAARRLPDHRAAASAWWDDVATVLGGMA
ncbi:polysaccharide pyruvyl transferase family protein [Microbacterium sp. 2FI]|uniref:polysaccharide pyruvyl transferase family protein n=1 Tax=Microbacterium sp. 2FI TaxID=2502193 RepID=UPI0010F8B9A8|nr:polysaccharide pyruvyl transferase family protein [Microbacterium sp. 2FI]